MKYILILISMLMLTGCVNSMELEKRDYVMAVGIDKNTKYDIAMSVAKLTEGSNKENQEEYIVEGSGNTIAEALNDANNKTKGNIYLGHNKVIILSDKFNSYDELIDYVNSNIELSRDIVIVKAANIREAVAGKNNDDSASEYIYSFYENKDKIDLDKLMDIYNNNENIDFPEVSIKNNKIIVE